MNEIFRAANLPVSVIIIKIGTASEENDSKNLMILSSKVFTECERAFIDILTYESYKKEGAPT